MINMVYEYEKKLVLRTFLMICLNDKTNGVISVPNSNLRSYMILNHEVACL